MAFYTPGVCSVLIGRSESCSGSLAGVLEAPSPMSRDVKLGTSYELVGLVKSVKESPEGLPESSWDVDASI